MKNKKLIILIVIIALCVVFSKHIRYFITGDEDVIVAPPTGFYFAITDGGEGDLYEISGLDEKTYITIDKKYLNNDDAYMYVSGDYWNSPEKPLIKFNGKVIDDVDTENSGYADGVFSDRYYSKLYHFYINETIKEGKEYTFYVRVKNTSKSETVVFTTN